MNRRGISHIEVVLSFLIFVGFVIFALYFFSPLQTGRIVDSSFDYTFREIKKYGLVDVETYSLSLDISAMSEDTIGVDLGLNVLGGNVRVENYLGNDVPSKRDGDYIYFKWANIDLGSGKGYARILISTDIDSDPDPPSFSPLIDYDKFEISSSNKNKLISEKKLILLKNRYNADYNTLKTEFKLPNRADFNFNLVKVEIITENKIPKGVEVFSKSERIEVLKENGEIIFDDLVLKIW